MMNKKAISPLIAWILILGFAVSLAAIVTIWYTQTAEDMAENTIGTFETGIECQNINYNVKFDEDCGVKVVNTGTMKILGFKSSTNEGETLLDNVNLLPRRETDTIGSFDWISIMPSIQPNEKILWCPKDQLYVCPTGAGGPEYTIPTDGSGEGGMVGIGYMPSLTQDCKLTIKNYAGVPIIKVVIDVTYKTATKLKQTVKTKLNVDINILDRQESEVPLDGISFIPNKIKYTLDINPIINEEGADPKNYLTQSTLTCGTGL